jgi:hypothetical protein
MDTVAIGQYTLHDQRICHAYSIETSVNSIDGIIGIGPPKGFPSVADVSVNMFQQLPEEHRTISIWYNHNSSLSEVAGQIIVGPPDTSKFAGRVSWNRMSSQNSQWNLDLLELRVGEGPNLMGTPTPALIDTGTTLVLLPQTLADEIANRMGALSIGDFYIIDCNVIDKIPSITIEFADQFVVLNGKQSTFYDASTRRCYSIFARSRSAVIFGAQFLRHFYTIFDWGNERIGFVKTDNSVTIQEYPFGNSKNFASTTSPFTLLSLISSLII